MAEGKELQLEPLVLLEDEPVPSHRVDELGLAPLAHVVAGTAVGTAGPFTIGVFADWGLGKTSVLRQAKSLIDDDAKFADVVTVWFNAWQFEKEEHPILPLVASIVRAVEKKRASREGAAGVMKKGWSEISRALRAVAYAFSVKGKIKVPGFSELEAGIDGKEMINRFDKLKAEDDPLLEQGLYYSAFEALADVAKVSGNDDAKNIPKIVVFIDDLDRCLPDNGLKLLESVKLVLAQRGFVFVLAVDRRILEGYLKKRYKEEFGIDDYAEGSASYLDKIVQLPLPLPPHRSRFENYIKDLLQRPTFEAHKEVRDTLEGLVAALARGANDNPRTLVRFINNLLVDFRMRQLSPGGEPDHGFVGLCVVARSLQQHLDARLYRFLVTAYKVCEAIAHRPGQPIWQRLKEFMPSEGRRDATKKEKEELDKWRMAGIPGKRLAELVTAFDRNEFLLDLLDDELTGKRWLMDHEARTAVDEFLAEREREEEKDHTASSTQIEIIDSAIRESLRLKSNELITDEHRERVTILNLENTGLNDEGAGLLSWHKSLVELYLHGNRLTDSALARLVSLTKLESLGLMGTHTTDTGLQHVARVRSLHWLSLIDNPISDNGLKHLTVLTSLEILFLRSTRATWDGRDALVRAIPGLRIDPT